MKDRSAVGITFAKKPPRHEMLIADSPIWRSSCRRTIRIMSPRRRFACSPTPASSVSPRTCTGAAKITAMKSIYPDGKRETLLSVPRWDFNWQSAYRFREPLKLAKGTKLHAVAHWDNSANNPLNPDSRRPSALACNRGRR